MLGNDSEKIGAEQQTDDACDQGGGNKILFQKGDLQTQIGANDQQNAEH